MMFPIQSDDLPYAHAQIDAALHHVAVRGGMPARHLGSVQKALEELRGASPWSVEAVLAEAIAVALHRIERARLAGDDASERGARCELRALSESWSDGRPVPVEDWQSA